MTDDDTPEFELCARGIAVLADDAADADDEGPTRVNGVAIGEDDITTGMSGKRTRWPAETLRDATAKLVGKPIVRNHPDPTSPQPPIEAIIGEVTDARYEDGVGLLWHGEIDDPAVADQIDRGRVEVSPVMARELGDYDDEAEAHVATEIHAFRDLGVVARGASASNSIQSGADADADAEAAMDAEALAGAFGASDTDPASGPDSSDGADSADSGDGSDDAGDGGASPRDDDPRDGASTNAASDTTPSNSVMSDDNLSDKERELLAQARQQDDPVVMPAAATERLDDADELLAAAQGIDSPTVVDESTYQTQQDRLGDLEAMMDQRLTEETGLREATVEAMSFDAKAAEFETDDGEFSPEALVQSPETGGSGEETAPNSGDSGDELSADEEERLEQLEQEIEFWDGRESMDGYVESLREERTELTGGS